MFSGLLRGGFIGGAIGGGIGAVVGDGSVGKGIAIGGGTGLIRGTWAPAGAGLAAGGLLDLYECSDFSSGGGSGSSGGGSDNKDEVWDAPMLGGQTPGNLPW